MIQSNKSTLSKNIVKQTVCSWDRERTTAELTSFINKRLARLANVSLD